MIRLVLAAGLLCSFIVFCDEAETTDSVTERDSVSQAGIAQDTGSTTKKAPEKKKKPSGKVNRILECAYNNKRFDGKKWLKDDHSFPPPGPPGHISRYDRLIKKMSRRFGFDWRLIAAQIYAESRFDTTAKSHVGAKGLMQIMPRTAKHLGTDPLRLHIPEVNVATGCLYDKRMVTLWKRNVDHPQERLAFALASYNAGRGRVLRSFVTDSLETWELVHPLLPGETQDYVHRIALKYDFYKRHALP
jgi:hypothetical protein